MVDLRIHNSENMEDEVVGISLCRRDQLKPDVVWAVLGKIIQSNARFVLSDRLEVQLDNVRMPAGNGRVRTKGRSLDVMSVIKKCIVTVKAAVNCLAYALISLWLVLMVTQSTNHIVTLEASKKVLKLS